mgnify:CR=1 FL=1
MRADLDRGAGGEHCAELRGGGALLELKVNCAGDGVVVVVILQVLERVNVDDARKEPLDGEAVPDAARLEPGAGVEPGRRSAGGLGGAAGVLTCRF